MIVLGVDENGLGPLLGPLIATCVGLRVSRYQRPRLLRLGRELGIDDSKVTAGFGAMGFAEGLCLAVVEALTGRLPVDADAVCDALFLEDPGKVRSRCPARSRAQCWGAPLSLPCFGGDIEQGRLVLGTLRSRGVEVVYLRSGVACTGDLNRRLEAGQSRVEVDLELMELLVLDAHRTAGESLRAVCGMVGGIRKYEDRLRHLPEGARPAKQRADGARAYTFPGLGEVSFEIDADSRHFPVALASMVGKYVRELWMERQNRFYRSRDPALAAVSGYHDPVTKRFMAQSEPLRVELGISDACFVRDSAKATKQRHQLALLDCLL